MEKQSNIEPINQEANNAIKDKWDGMSAWYADNVDISSTQGIVTCAVMTKMHEAKRTIEVGCGPGKHSLVIASTFLRNDGGVLVSCDYSKDMVKRVK